MMVPTIHSNGTGKTALEQEVYDALEYLQDAIRMVARMTVNGRDYYPQGAGALEAADREHAARLAKLREVEAELSSYVEAIAEGGHAAA